MKYIPRHAERKFTNMSSFFKVVLVTGASIVSMKLQYYLQSVTISNKVQF